MTVGVQPRGSIGQGSVGSSRGVEKCQHLGHIFLKTELRTLASGLGVVNKEERGVKEDAKVFGLSNEWMEVLTWGVESEFILVNTKLKIDIQVESKTDN